MSDKKPNQDIRAGDLIQWECGGCLMFPDLKKVTGLSDCGKFCFVEGTRTGIPTDQVVEVRKTVPLGSERYLEFAQKLVAYYGRMAFTDKTRDWNFCRRTVERWSRLIARPNLEQANLLKKLVSEYNLGEGWTEFSQALAQWFGELPDERPKKASPSGIPTNNVRA